MNTRTFAIAAGLFLIVLTGLTPARADICREYRTAIDALVAESAGMIALKDTLEAARSGIRAARAMRAALVTLESESSMAVLEASGAPMRDRLVSADAATTAAIETFEGIFTRTRAITNELSSARAEEFEAARVAADAAADPALDVLGAVESVSRRGVLKAASTSAHASPGRTTTSALNSVHEAIFRAACE